MINKVILIVYTYNFFIVEKNEKDIFYIKALLKQKFNIKDLAKMQIVLSIKIKRFE